MSSACHVECATSRRHDVTVVSDQSTLLRIHFLDIHARLSMCSVARSIAASPFVFFFTSRRRHTRCSRDWISDVCSSDLYATMGESAAWIIGWDLVLESAAGAATVGVGWSGHFVSLLGLFGIRIPASLTAPPTQLCTATQGAAHVVGCAHPGLNLTGASVNLPAVAIVALMSAVLVIGIKDPARVNSLIVILKVGIVLLVVLVGLPHVRPANWTPFIPPNTGEWGSYGWAGVRGGAGLGFFSTTRLATGST